MLEVILESIIDSLKIIPFLFFTYLIMEYIEHKTTDKTRETIKKSGKYGPIIGGILGLFPQCGFSVSATNLYVARIITLGTLISVYLSTSDEMIPILISNQAPIEVILKILGIKLVIGVLAGIIIDLVIRMKEKGKEEEEEKIHDLCEHDHCHCEKNILKASISHTLHITLFIFLVTLAINILIYFIGEHQIAGVLKNQTILGPVVASLVGLIPNCAASVIITQLYIGNVQLISAASMIAGLLANAGIGLIVLFRMNKDIKSNLKILGLIYFISVFSGIVLELLKLNI